VTVAPPGPCLPCLTALTLVVLAAGCGGGNDATRPAPAGSDYTAFTNPERVTVIGYGADAMEPFVSRDGVYLFFNSSGANKDILFAALINPTSAQFQGAIASINTPAVEGTPTLDAAGRFFFVSTANYNPPAVYDTLYSGTWNGSTVTSTAPLSGLAKTTLGIVDFDLEVSPDGTTVYFAEGDFSGGNDFPDTADLHIAVSVNGAFVRDANSNAILANVNTASQLEYAPAISANGLELFFTRLNLANGQARIYRSTRASTTAAFGVPQVVSAITSFAEGPALSPDEKSLYYHQENAGRFDIYLVTRP
jgi:hypothetical protein